MTHASVHVLPDAQRVAELAAEIIANRMLARPGVRMLMPTGATPLPLYAALRRRHAAGLTAPAGARVLQLDEYIGIDPEGPSGYRSYLRRELEGTGLELAAFLDPGAADLDAECARYQALLDRDEVGLAVLGLGRDGHVGFDEPGSSPGSGVRVVQLAEPTRLDAAAAFGGIANVPTRAITVGMRTLLTAREVLLLVTGEGKARALHAALSGTPRAAVPASLLRAHPQLTILCDEAAASELPGRAAADHALVVLGHREPGISRQHRASHESFERLALALRLAAADPPRAVVLTGFTTDGGGSSEAEQMAVEWTGAAPLLLEVAGRDTAENATRSLPFLLALGVRRVTIVTSAWHIRAPLYFARYRRHGLRVRVRREWGGPWLRMLAHELRLLPRVPRALRRAWADVRLPPGPLA